MSEQERQQTKQWIETWKITGVELRKIKMAELAAMTDKEAQAVTSDLLRLGQESYFNPAQWTYSGLMEQQRIFKRAHKKRYQHMIIKVLEAAEEIQQFCLAQQWKFCFIGGVAVQRWGEPRLTQDADLTLLTGFGEETRFIEPLVTRYNTRISNALQFAQRNRVVLLSMSNGIPVDIGLGGLPFEEHTIMRASRAIIAEGYELITCSAEDLIVHKAFASRPQDWLDVETILMRQGSKLNMQIVWEELAPLVELKEDPQILVRLQTLVDEILGASPKPSLLVKPTKRKKKNK
jgi:hypothetical protein